MSFYHEPQDVNFQLALNTFSEITFLWKQMVAFSYENAEDLNGSEIEGEAISLTDVRLTYQERSSEGVLGGNFHTQFSNGFSFSLVIS